MKIQTVLQIPVRKLRATRATRAAAPILEVIRMASFRSLWLGQVCSQLAVNMLLFVLALTVYTSTGSNAAVSGLFLSYGVPAVLFGVVAGVVADHFDKRRLLIACDLTRSVLVMLLLFTITSGSLVSVYILVFLSALITQFYIPAEAPTIPRLVTPAQLVSANSLFSFTYFSSMAIGFILAGPMIRALGVQGTLILISVLFVASAASITRLPAQPGSHSLTSALRHDVYHIFSRVVSDLLAGIRYVMSSSVLFDALFLLTSTQIILALLGTLGPGFADRVLQIDVRDASLLIIGPVVAGILVGSVWVGTVGYRRTPSSLIKTGIVATGILLMLISLTVRLKRYIAFGWLFHEGVILPLELLLFFLLGLSNSLLDVPANSVLQREAQGDMRSRVYGILAASVGGIGMIPVVAGGVLADIFGVGKVIFFLGLTILLYGIYRVRYNTHSF